MRASAKRFIRTEARRSTLWRAGSSSSSVRASAEPLRETVSTRLAPNAAMTSSGLFGFSGPARSRGPHDQQILDIRILRAPGAHLCYPRHCLTVRYPLEPGGQPWPSTTQNGAAAADVEEDRGAPPPMNSVPATAPPHAIHSQRRREGWAATIRSSLLGDSRSAIGSPRDWKRLLGSGARQPRRDARCNMTITRRPETPADEPFLRQMIIASVAQELMAWTWPEAIRDHLLGVQYTARVGSLHAHYPAAASEIILVDGQPAGWIFLEESPEHIHLCEI